MRRFVGKCPRRLTSRSARDYQLVNEIGVTSSNRVWASGGKRLFDLFAATVLLVVLSPVLLVASVLVKLSSRGPLLFVQERAGRHAKPFRLIKLRTMRGDRTPDPKELVPLDHPEITAVGRILRRFKVDELPHLVNVLAGDMSLVGPRPTLLDQVARYDEFRRQRLLVRPGITGLAQVCGNSLVSWDERILFDITYVRRCGPLMDLAILLGTVGVVLLGERRTTQPFSRTRYRRYVDPPPGYGGA